MIAQVKTIQMHPIHDLDVVKKFPEVYKWRMGLDKSHHYLAYPIHWVETPEEEVPYRAALIARLVTEFPEVRWVVGAPFVSWVEFYLGYEPTQEYRIQNAAFMVAEADELLGFEYPNKKEQAAAISDFRRLTEGGYYRNLSSPEAYTAFTTGVLDKYGISTPLKEYNYVVSNKRQRVTSQALIVYPHDTPKGADYVEYTEHTLYWGWLNNHLNSRAMYPLLRGAPEEVVSYNVCHIFGGNADYMAKGLKWGRTKFSIVPPKAPLLWCRGNVVFCPCDIAGEKWVNIYLEEGEMEITA